MAYIAAGELAGERVAGLVEEDGDELERREQERPPELQKKTPHGRTHDGESGSPSRRVIQPERDREQMRRRRGGGTHEEDDDGGDAHGGDEDLLVVVAAALQLPVDGHPPVAAAADLLSGPPARIRGRRGSAAGGGAHRSSKWKLPCPGALARSNWKRACGLRAQEPRARWAGGAGGCGGRVCCVRGAYGPRDFDCSSPRRPADARSARAAR